MTVKKRHWKRYKEKECPVCHEKHRGPNTYCSLSCSNRGRTITPEHKANTSRAMLRYYRNTPEGISKRQQFVNMNNGLTITRSEDIDIPLPGLYDPDFDYDY